MALLQWLSHYIHKAFLMLKVKTLYNKECRFNFMFFRCEKNCLHAYIEPNMVSTVVLLYHIMGYVKGSSFQVLKFSSSSSWSLFTSVHLCLHASSVLCQASLSNSPFYDLNLLANMSDDFHLKISNEDSGDTYQHAHKILQHVFWRTSGWDTKPASCWR